MLLLLVACADAPDSKASPDTAIDTADSTPVGHTGETADSADSGETGETGETGDSGPVEDPVLFSDLTITAAPDMPTALTLSWTTDPASASWLEYGDSDAYGDATAEDAETTDHSVTIPLLAAGTTWHFRAHAKTSTGDDTTWTVDAAPDWLPELTVDGDSDELGGKLVMPLIGSDGAVTVVDTKGRYLWWHEVPDGYYAPRAFLTQDGSAIAYSEVDTSDYGPDGHLVLAPLAGGDATTIDVPYLSHDFVELPDGSFGCISKDIQNNYVGDRLVEVQRDGTLEVVWSVFDYFNEENYEDKDDWTHANALRYDPTDDAWYVSLRNLNTVLKSDRSSRQLVWRLTTSSDNFAYVDGAEPTELQHGFQLLADDHLLVFDNRDGDTSRAVEYALDEPNNEVTQVWSYDNPEGTNVMILGNVERYDSGDTMVDWSTDGRVEVVDEAQDVLWQLQAPSPAFLGYTTRIFAD